MEAQLNVGVPAPLSDWPDSRLHRAKVEVRPGFIRQAFHSGAFDALVLALPKLDDRSRRFAMLAARATKRFCAVALAATMLVRVPPD